MLLPFLSSAHHLLVVLTVNSFMLELGPSYLEKKRGKHCGILRAASPGAWSAYMTTLS